jgi:hypothetical protein
MATLPKFGSFGRDLAMQQGLLMRFPIVPSLANGAL